MPHSSVVDAVIPAHAGTQRLLAMDVMQIERHWVPAPAFAGGKLLAGMTGTTP
jgi:hypothetical protein